jgi:hypothetical protein
MERYLTLILTTYGMALGIVILVGLCAHFLAKTPEGKYKWFAITALVLAVYATLTSWLWMYYLNFFYCLPFLLASLGLMFLAKRHSTGKLLKAIWWFQGIAVTIALTGLIFLIFLRK